VPSKEFARAIGRAVHRPSWAPVPGFVLRLLFGEMAQNILILGQRVVPKRTMELGFRFEDDQIEAALKRVLG
jgi:NAD dependent epimerase/dehydratase family enzyme